MTTTISHKLANTVLANQTRRFGQFSNVMHDVSDYADLRVCVCVWLRTNCVAVERFIGMLKCEV